MKQSRDYLEEALTLMGDMSDTEKAKRLKIAQPTISQYRAGNRKMDDFACIMVARVLGIDPMRIIAACQEEREKSEERREFWRDFRSTLGGWIAAPLAFLILQAATAQPAQASALAAQNHYDIVFIMSNMAYRIRRYFSSAARSVYDFVQLFCLCHLQHYRHTQNA